MKFTKSLPFLLLVLLLINLNTIRAQSAYPQEYFRAPIEGRIYLSGTFGELRSNHFHAGIDIKTGGVEGKNVFAAADGWVARVKISPWGYGNAIYIEHPNGYTTVYGHLKVLKGNIANYVKQEQYKKQSFAVDVYLKPHQFDVEKGSIIALSGNTGGSGGPHLHFEIRETVTQEPINPLLFGIQVKDYITPIIKSIRIYPATTGSLVQGKEKAENFILKGWGNNYQLKNGDSIKVKGDFYLGISTTDKQNDSHNNNGVFQIDLFADSSLIYSHHVERLNFANTRYINTLIDYEYYKTKKRRYQRTYISPNNKLALYHQVQNGGIISFNDYKYHLLQYIVKDVKGNTSILQFTVFSSPIDSVINHSQTSVFNPLTKNIYSDKDIQITFPANSLYDTLSFDTVTQSSNKYSLSPIFHIGKPSVGLQKSIDVNFKHVLINDSLKNQIYIGRVNGKKISAYKGQWKNKQLAFKTKSFGNYGVFVDSIPPNIIFKSSPEEIRKTKTIFLTVTDKESGIKKYNAWLNGKWVLLQWDPKKNKMFYELDIKLQDKNEFKVIISDLVGNIQTQKLNL